MMLQGIAKNRVYSTDEYIVLDSQKHVITIGIKNNNLCLHGRNLANNMGGGGQN
jgi:hypothetical protein